MENKLKSVKELKELILALSKCSAVNSRQSQGLQNYFWTLTATFYLRDLGEVLVVLKEHNVDYNEIRNPNPNMFRIKLEIEIGE